MTLSIGILRHRPVQAVWACLVVLIVSGFWLGGCVAASPASASTTRSFSLELYVAGEDQSSNPLALRARYVVMEDRRLHVVLGPAARERTFPRPYRTLSVDEFDRLVRFVDDHHLLAEPTSPAVHAAERGGPAPAVRYVVSLSRDGHSNRYETTPGESPPTTALLAALSSFRGADLGDASVPQ